MWRMNSWNCPRVNKTCVPHTSLAEEKSNVLPRYGGMIVQIVHTLVTCIGKTHGTERPSYLALRSHGLSTAEKQAQSSRRNLTPRRCKKHEWHQQYQPQCIELTSFQLNQQYTKTNSKCFEIDNFAKQWPWLIAWYWRTLSSDILLNMNIIFWSAFGWSFPCPIIVF